MDTIFGRGWHRSASLLVLIFSSLVFGQQGLLAAQSVTLSWTASDDPNVAGYNVYYGVASRTYTNKVDVGSGTTVTINGLIEGTTYYFAATAYNILGVESDYSDEVSYTAPVPGNVRPTLNAIAGITINEDAPQQTVNLTGVTSGSVNETQTLTVTATSSNPGLIPAPTVTYTSPNTTGSLSFTPVANLSGSAVISVTVNDGQSANNLVTQTFTVTVNAVNDLPTLNALSNVTVNEDASLQTISLEGISSGAPNESQTLTVTATSSNSGLIPNPTVNYSSPNATGSLSFTPVANAFGSATITVSVNDGAGSNNIVTKTFSVTVNGVNDVPTLNALSNLSIAQNAGQQTVSLLGVTSGAANETQSLSVTASSSNPGLIPNPTVSYTSPNATGSLKFTPVANVTGSATITVTVNDGGSSNNIVTRTFDVMVNAVNQAPTLNALSNITMNQNGGQKIVNLSGITSGATNESQTLTVTAASSNTGLIPNPTIAYTSPNTTGSLSFAPLTNAFGTATITVTVNDGSTSNNIVTRTFTVTVNAVNQPPTLNPLDNLTLNLNAGLQTVNLSGISSGAPNENQTLSVTASSSNTGVIPNPTVTYSSPNPTGKITFTPVFLATGSATITVTVNDGGASNNIVSRTFTVSINSAPTITAIPNQNISVNSNAGPIEFTINDQETSVGSLTLSASSSSPTLIPTNNIIFGGTASLRTVTLMPVLGKSGTANVTISVNDGFSTSSTTFQLNVIAPPQPPKILTIVTNGAGTVSGAASGQPLTAGKTYTLTAVPEEGQEFAGWSGGIRSSSPKIAFVMSSNLTVQANFVPSPYTMGSYNGLFYEDEKVQLPSSGFFTVSVTKHGAYSGRLQVGASKLTFTGKLDLNCRATNSIVRKFDTPLILILQLGTNDLADQITGELSDGNWTAHLQGDRAVFGKTNAAPFAGNYTLVIPGADGNSAAPEGHGYGTIRVDTMGRARFAGLLADGTKLTAMSPLSKDGAWPVYASLYSGKGAVVSWLTFSNRIGDDLTGALSWIKSADPLAKVYPQGFDTESDAIGSSFIVPPVGVNFLDASSGLIAFSGGNLASDFFNSFQIGYNNKIANLSSNPLSLAFSSKTGMFKGKVTDPLTARSSTFGGVWLQKANIGYGSLMGTNLSSRVEINL
ncbi:MAG: tandem-95 repeat protein [Verrucomicrobiota bacterium]